jgi:hypothetical protein
MRGPTVIGPLGNIFLAGVALRTTNIVLVRVRPGILWDEGPQKDIERVIIRFMASLALVIAVDAKVEPSAIFITFDAG